MGAAFPMVSVGAVSTLGALTALLGVAVGLAVGMGASVAVVIAFGVAMTGGAAGTLAMVVALKSVNSSMKSIAGNAKSAQSSLSSIRSSVNVVNSGLDALGNKAKSAISALISQFSNAEGKATSDKKITRLLDILNAFDAEAEFALETKNYGTVKIEARYLNIYKRRGDEIVSDHLQDEINITNVEMNRSLKDLRTAINLTGKQIEGTENQYTTIAGLEYDDGEYFSPIGNPILYSRKAMDKWLPVRQYDKGLVMNWSYDTDNASELLQRGKNELQKYDDVKVSYTVEGVIKGEIGNYVEINTSKLGKPLLLKARIIEQEICLEDETKNKNIIGEYIIGTDETNETYKLMQEILNNTVVSAAVNAQYEHMVNNVLDNQMRCILYAANSKEVDVEGNYLYKWSFSFCDQNGIQIKAITKTGKNIVLQSTEWPENAASVNYEVEWEVR